MKVPSGLTREEQETIFRCNAGSKEFEFYSRDPKFKRLLERRGYTIQEDHQGLWSSTIPVSRLSVRSAKSRRKLSPEQASLLQERLREGRKTISERKNDPQVVKPSPNS